VFARRSEDQSIIQHSASFDASIALKTRQNARENSGHQPHLPVGSDGAMRRTAFNELRDPFRDLGRPPVFGIQESARGNQFRFRNRRVPRVGGANGDHASRRKTIALMLSPIGVNGMMAYAVGRRWHEFGIRMSLGARPSDLLKLVTRQALLLNAAGVAIGLAGAWALTRLMSSRSMV
jgi:hypothetical protein